MQTYGYTNQSFDKGAAQRKAILRLGRGGGRHKKHLFESFVLKGLRAPAIQITFGQAKILRQNPYILAQVVFL